MNKWLVGTVVAGAVAAITLTTIYSNSRQTPAPAAGAGTVSEVQHRNGSASAPSLAAAQRLEAEMKIPPGSFKPMGSKAYEIIRGNRIRPPGDALTHARQLIDRSRSGDANAAYDVYLTVRECQTFASQHADELADSARSVGKEGQFLQRSERMLKECESLILDKDIYEADWLSTAAAMGSQSAMRTYANSPEDVLGSLDKAVGDPDKVAEWRRNAQQYLTDLSSQGNVSALWDLASAYTYGGVVDADPVMAAAYSRVVNRVNSSFITPDQVSEIERRLSAKELMRVKSASDEIYNKCCVKQ